MCHRGGSALKAVEKARKGEERAKASVATITEKSLEWQRKAEEWQKKAEASAADVTKLQDAAEEAERLQAEVERLQRVAGERESALEDLKSSSQAEIEKLSSSLKGWRANYNDSQTALKRAKMDAINWYKGSSYFINNLSSFAAEFFASGMQAGAAQMVRRTPDAVPLELDYDSQEGIPFPKFNPADYPDEGIEQAVSAGTVPSTPTGTKRA